MAHQNLGEYLHLSGTRPPIASFRLTCPSLYEKGVDHDVVVLTEERTYKLHKMMICLRSEELRELCEVDLKLEPGSSTESTTRTTLDLTSDDAHAVECMLQYLYKDNYFVEEIDVFATQLADQAQTRHTIPCVNLLHVRVYRLAEKYGLPGLRDLALRKFGTAAEERWDTEDFLHAANEVYQTSGTLDRDLHNVVVRVFATRKGALIRKDRTTTLLMRIPLLAIHLLKFPNQWL